MSDVQASRKEILKSAASWYSLLCSEDVTKQQKQAHHAWLEADPVHMQVWKRVENLRQQLQSVPGSPSFHALRIKQNQGQNRRTVLRGFAVLATGTALGSLAWQQPSTGAFVDSWTASHRTGRGERREYILEDGTQLVLNTATSLDVVETPDFRLLRLYEGEVFIRTGKGGQGMAVAKALQVHTDHGIVMPLGTVFTVRKQDAVTQVNVIEDEVELTPVSGAGKSQYIVAGEQAQMSANTVEVSAGAAQADSWIRGLLVAVDWPLDRLVAELSRYRSGILRCDPAVSSLRLSGTFPLDDPDRALEAIANALPVKVDRLTNYWVTISPSQSNAVG